MSSLPSESGAHHGQIYPVARRTSVPARFPDAKRGPTIWSMDPEDSKQTDAEVKIAELEALWRRLSEECMGLKQDVQRVEAGRKVVLRALVEARDALRVGDARAALRIIEDALANK